jgi:hypothetical protein
MGGQGNMWVDAGLLSTRLSNTEDFPGVYYKVNWLTQAQVRGQM